MKKTNVKKQKNINMKSEKGSITLYVVISMLFFLIIVSGLYINSSYKIQKQNKEIDKIQEEYKADINDIYEKALVENSKLLSEAVKVGDYVKYIPDTVNTTDTTHIQLISELGTYSGNTDTSYNTSSTIVQETNLNWRVLDIVEDENGNDCVRLISEKPTISRVRLEGYNGYNNVVYLIDKTCNVLYNNSKYAKNVQNLKLEDIEEYMVTKPIYDTTTTNSPKNLFYPIILEQEAGQTVNGETGTLEKSEQTVPIEQEARKEVTSWSLKKNYIDNQTMQLSSFNNIKYYNLFINDGENNYETYWISTRGVAASPDYAFFGGRIVIDGKIHIYGFYNSYDGPYGESYALRPVIILKSDVLIDTEKSGDGSEVGKEYILR